MTLTLVNSSHTENQHSADAGAVSYEEEVQQLAEQIQPELARRLSASTPAAERVARDCVRGMSPATIHDILNGESVLLYDALSDLVAGVAVEHQVPHASVYDIAEREALRFADDAWQVASDNCDPSEVVDDE
jgi:hypothetical protein